MAAKAYPLSSVPLVDKSGKQVAAPSNKVVALYFSAHWCAPCLRFTPLLKKFHETLKASANDSLEIVFVSDDKSEKEFQDYYQNNHGDWLAVDFNASVRTSMRQHYDVKSIPCLLVVNGQGEVVARDLVAAVTGAQESPAATALMALWAKAAAAGHRNGHGTNSANVKSTFEAAMGAEGEGTHEVVKEYYSKHLETSEDLQTNACCTTEAPPEHIREAMANVHIDVTSKYYGCGLCVPEDIEGLSILDLGSGSGRDCYIAAQLVGATGRVVGVDMTQEQLDVANNAKQWHAEKFGYSNVEFKLGQIERLGELGLADGSFDVIVSNCVINLCQDKAAVLNEAFRLLKPGGELYFSDVYSDRRMPKELRDDPVLWGECVSGALYWNDFQNLAKSCGFLDPRLMKDNVLTINNEKLEKKLGNIKCFSATYRLWKLPDLESHCEDYGQAVIYKGTCSHCPVNFILDGHHSIEKGRIFPVCGNTWKMLHETRFKRHFEFIGNFNTHYGIYDGCGTLIPFESAREGSSGGGASCC